MSSFKPKVLAVAVLGVLVFSACSKAAAPPSASDSTTSGTTTVQIKALDTLRFDPAAVTVRAGEKVRFVVTNAGKTDHEFVVGDKQVQMAHEDAMGSKSHMQMEALAALDLKPGETKEATVTFDKPGVVMFGCHQPGHYKGGMVGTVTVA